MLTAFLYSCLSVGAPDPTPEYLALQQQLEGTQTETLSLRPVVLKTKNKPTLKRTGALMRIYIYIFSDGVTDQEC